MDRPARRLEKGHPYPRSSRLIDVKENRGSSFASRLSKAEIRVLELLCEGLTNPEIGTRLHVSPRTVQSHLYNIFKKLRVRSRTELVALVVRERSTISDPDTTA